MVIGGALLIFSLTLGDGTHEQWIDSAVRMGSGHVLIQTPRFQASRKIEDRLSSRSRMLAEIALAKDGITEHVVTISPRLAISGLASSPTGARPVQIMGIVADAESEFTVLNDKVVEGRYLIPADGRAAYVAAGLAESLDLQIDSRLVLTAQDTDGEIASLLVRVLGIFRTGIPEIDYSLVHIPLSTAGQWLSTSSEEVSTIAILLDSVNSVQSVTSALQHELKDILAEGTIKVMSWRDANPEVDAAVKIDNFGNYMFQSILFTIIALSIVNTVLMSVLQRYREFGVLQALGLTPLQTGSVVLIEGLILSIVNSVSGIALGLFVTWYFWGDGMDLSALSSEEWSFAGIVMDPLIVPSFRLVRVIQSLVFIMSVGVLASVYPAIRASTIDVAEAMKFER